ncbi:MAG: hypothetical protein Q7R33_08680 [Nitrosarchaeum sp.]|nr:hypothetical protein [Nitrosarchaeum sp.]
MMKCFVCEEKVPGKSPINLTVYKNTDCEDFFFHEECFQLKIEEETGTCCIFCKTRVTIHPWSMREEYVDWQKRTFTFADLWWNEGWKRICIDCWYKNIDIPLEDGK